MEIDGRVARLEADMIIVNHKLFPTKQTSKDFKFSNGSFYSRKGKQIHPNSKEGRVIQSIIVRQRDGIELDKMQQKELDEIKEEIKNE